MALPALLVTAKRSQTSHPSGLTPEERDFGAFGRRAEPGDLASVVDAAGPMLIVPLNVPRFRMPCPACHRNRSHLSRREIGDARHLTGLIDGVALAEGRRPGCRGFGW